MANVNGKVANVAMLPITHCKDCPFKTEANQWSSDGWDRMEDWLCKHPKLKDKPEEERKIEGCVEWHDVKSITIPDWCPLIVKTKSKIK